ncbi:MAG: AAA family ATPase [Dechloromonas sp.]|jgi:MSHA biogenesis protein MshM|nr:AAA family ATPase [Dechloromonas sp.]
MSLYLEHFGLREPPFRITPHTDFFFTGANRGPTLDALIYAITQDEGIVKVTGEVGSGKTMLCRMLLERLPADVESLYLANPSLSRHEILGAIADELGIPADGRTTHSMIRTLQDALVERYAAGKRVVIMIDEAHAMPAESLEEIRLLSNLESKATKLLQIALFAQPELDDRLAANDMRQLRERITQHFNLAPLKVAEVGGYIEFRLRAAGYRGPTPFTARAIDLIAKISEGLSRRINILADKALLAAYSGGGHQVDVAEVRIAAQDARFAPLRKDAGGGLAPALKIAAALLMTLAVAALAYTLWPKPPAGSPAAAPPPGEPAAVAAPVAVPTAPPPAAKASPRPVADGATLVARHTALYADWLASAPGDHYFIQLTARGASHTDDIERFLSRARQWLEPAQLRVYVAGTAEDGQIGVIYGDYPSRAAAWEATRAFPEEIRRMRPYPRPVSALQ